MRRIRLPFLLFSLALTASLMAQEDPSDPARWISKLKQTPVDQLGSRLPRQNFAEWFAGLVGQNETGYEVEECHVSNPVEGVTDQLFCITVYTKPPHPGWRRWIQLSFRVGSIPPRYIFQRGIESPVNPKMARPDRVFSELSDLEEVVRRSHPVDTAGLRGPPT